MAPSSWASVGALLQNGAAVQAGVTAAAPGLGYFLCDWRSAAVPAGLESSAEREGVPCWPMGEVKALWHCSALRCKEFSFVFSFLHPCRHV